MIGWIVIGIIAVVLACAFTFSSGCAYQGWQITGQVVSIALSILFSILHPMTCGVWMGFCIFGFIVLIFAVPMFMAGMALLSGDIQELYMMFIWACIMCICNFFNPMGFLL